jgi:hypothetical protein
MVEWAYQRKKTEKDHCLNMKGYSRNIKLLQPIAAYLQAQTSLGKEKQPVWELQGSLYDSWHGFVLVIMIIELVRCV